MICGKILCSSPQAACPEMKRGKISCVTWSDFLQDADYRAGEVTFMDGTEGG